MNEKKLDYMLWLVPEGEDFEILQAEIARISKELHSPHFIPHVTVGLLSGLRGEEIKSRAQLLAQSCGPLTIDWARLNSEEDYFRCLFLEASPSDSCDFFYQKFLKTFSGHIAIGLNQEKIDKFRPHLSIAYGSFKNSEKDHLIKISNVASLPRTLRFTHLSIVAVDGTVSGSRVLEKIPLQPRVGPG